MQKRCNCKARASIDDVKKFLGYTPKKKEYNKWEFVKKNLINIGGGLIYLVLSLFTIPYILGNVLYNSVFKGKRIFTPPETIGKLMVEEVKQQGL